MCVFLEPACENEGVNIHRSRGIFRPVGSDRRRPRAQ